MPYVVANRLIWAGSKMNKGIEGFTKSCVILKPLLKFQIVNGGLVKLVKNKLNKEIEEFTKVY